MTLTHLSPGSGTQVAGKFLNVGGRRYLVKGVAYGTFAPDDVGCQFPSQAQVKADFALMAQTGINTVRTYTVPNDDFLDQAEAAGLRVIVGVPWAQHVAFLDDRVLTRSIRGAIVDTARRLSTHPATLLVVVGNEIPHGIVRWHGAARIERFFRDVYAGVKDAAPDMLFTYVNYPPTEHLELPFFDVCAFNVYLHYAADLRAYLAHLHIVAGDRPLLLAEVGADSIKHGEQGQADLASMQLRTAFEGGACGTVIFSWTDEWWRGGQLVKGWRFGLTDITRRPKLALFGVSREYSEAACRKESRVNWPSVSVLVCAHNAAATIDECLHSLQVLDYPNYDVVVVNDGSTDTTGTIARQHDQVTVIDTDHVGLSNARNIAIKQSTGTIVAFTDADVRVDTSWLTYLVQPFLQSGAIGSGGPNVVPGDDPWVAQCVARAPGSPTHVLIDDRTAEHVPGCNMAFRRDVLVSVGGFDSAYRAAGDDVDICWRLQAHGHRIEFSPSALVWHRHRSSVKAYWRQQVGYGEAETWLMDAHPERFLDGQALWKGRIYSSLPFARAISRVRVNAGVWGTAMFPGVYSAQVPSLASLPHLMPWQMLSLLLAFIGAMCFIVGQHRVATVLLILASAGTATTICRCLVYGWKSDISRLPLIGPWDLVSRIVCRMMIALLHLVQPVARAWGRFRGRLWAPLIGDRRRRSSLPQRPSVLPVSWFHAVPLLARRLDVMEFWSERWVDRTILLSEITNRLRSHSVARTVDARDPWQLDHDLAISTGRWGWVELRTLLEEHDGGRCLFRVAARHRLTLRGTIIGVMIAAGIVALAPLSQAVPVLAMLGLGSVVSVSAWSRTARVYAGVRAIVGQVATEHGFILFRTRATSLSSGVRQTEDVSPHDGSHSLTNPTELQ